MQGCCTSFCTSSHAWCYATVCRLALPHIHDATLVYVVLHFLTYMMQLHCMSSCTSSHTWCNSTVCRLALPYIYDATLLFIFLHFLTYMGKQFPQKPLQAHCRNCEEHLAQKKDSAAEVFYISSEKYARTFSGNWTLREMQNHCDLWYEINDEHCKRWKRGFDKQPAGMFMVISTSPFVHMFTLIPLLPCGYLTYLGNITILKFGKSSFLSYTYINGPVFIAMLNIQFV